MSVKTITFIKVHLKEDILIPKFAGDNTIDGVIDGSILKSFEDGKNDVITLRHHNHQTPTLDIHRDEIKYIEYMEGT